MAQNLATGPLLLGIIVPGLADWHATETTVLTFANILVAGASAAIFPLIAQRPIADAVRLET